MYGDFSTILIKFYHLATALIQILCKSIRFCSESTTTLVHGSRFRHEMMHEITNIMGEADRYNKLLPIVCNSLLHLLVCLLTCSVLCIMAGMGGESEHYQRANRRLDSPMACGLCERSWERQGGIPASRCRLHSFHPRSKQYLVHTYN